VIKQINGPENIKIILVKCLLQNLFIIATANALDHYWPVQIDHQNPKF